MKTIQIGINNKVFRQIVRREEPINHRHLTVVCRKAHQMFKSILRYAINACLIFITGTLLGQKPVSISSPDKKIKFVFELKPAAPLYSVYYKGRPVILRSALGLSFRETGEFKSGLAMGQVKIRSGQEKYELVTGRNRFVNESFNECSIPLSSRDKVINIVVRAFNDGIAFRYEFPNQQGSDEMVLTEENTTFHFAGDPMILGLMLPNYTTSHEGLYTNTTLSAIPPDTLLDMPMLFEMPGSLYAAVTEAALSNYAGMYLSYRDGVLISRLSPLPSDTSVKVRATMPHKSPWRVVMISDHPGKFLESNMLTNLNEPCRIPDLSWIRPGKTTFPWWNGNIVPDTLNAPGNNFVTNQYYIDFCARNGIEYHSVVEYGLHQWYTDDGVNFQPGPNTDVTKPVPGLDMKQICDYAKSRGIGVRVWVHWAALYPKLDEAFAVFEQWGLSGMMIDFMDRDDQEMVRIQEEMLVKAAQHKLHIQFHGAYKPTGMNRTYPNEFTREGTLNYEVNKWEKRITPDHDLDIAFTRMIAGATDYHMGGFRAVQDSAFRVQYTRPLMLGTRCHMLAMYVVLESYLGMVCDYPAAYEGEPGFDFVQAVPTTWDETTVVLESLHNYLGIARRKNDDWFVGVINNHESRTIDLPLRFLKDESYNVTVYTDASDIHSDPNQLQKFQVSVTGNDRLTLHLAAGGGAAVLIRKE